MLQKDEMLCFSLGVAMRRISKIYADALAEHDITPPQLFLLTSLGKQDGLRGCDLAQQVCLDSSSLTGLIDRTEKLGLVERRPDPDDRRAQRIFLTATGKTRLADLQPVVADVQQRVQEEFFSGYSDEDVATFTSMLQKIRAEVV
jgi:DNA-binding MarR family transcriptional regulator